MQYDGSLIVVPVQTPPYPPVGTINVDTLQPVSPAADGGLQQPPLPSLPDDPSTVSSSHLSPSSFQEHEALFYQGVGQCVGEVHQWISNRISLLHVSLSALKWIHSRFIAIQQGEVYLVTENPKRDQEEPFLLHLMVSTTSSAPPNTNIHKRVKKQANPFKQYLFECVETSEPFSAEAYGEMHLVHPIRDHMGCAVALVDLTVSTLQSCSLDGGQLREVIKVLNLLTSTFYHLNHPLGAKGSQKEEELPQEEGQRYVFENVTTGTHLDMSFECTCNFCYTVEPLNSGHPLICPL